MTGNKTSAKDRVKLEMDNIILKFWKEFHCTILQQSLCGKILKFQHIMKVVA
jgi:hypothetical protein